MKILNCYDCNKEVQYNGKLGPHLKTFCTECKNKRTKRTKGKNTMKKPLNYYGFAFDEDMTEERRIKLQKQLEETGIDESEVWNLDYTIACFILPRLKLYKEIKNGYPGLMSEEEWDISIDKMINSFELLIEDRATTYPHEYQEGLKEFLEHFGDLWD